MPPASPLARVCERKVREVKILGWIINTLELIMTPVSRGVFEKSFRITADLLELIVGCTLAVSYHIGRLNLSKGCILSLFEFQCHLD